MYAFPRFFKDFTDYIAGHFKDFSLDRDIFGEKSGEIQRNLVQGLLITLNWVG